MESPAHRLPTRTNAAKDPVFSSSPAFATPVHPIRVPVPNALDALRRNGPGTSRAAPILPVLLPPATLRPIAFRTFTKKHNLTLTSSALQALASFIGQHCGAAWREEGLAELVLEEVAKAWRRADGRAIVDGDGAKLRDILQQTETQMHGGRIIASKGARSLSRQSSLLLGPESGSAQRNESQESFNMSGLEMQGEEDDDSEDGDPRKWLKVVNAFEQPRLHYNPVRKHYELANSHATFFPSAAQKTEFFRQRYHIIHQRLLRSAAFEAASTTQQTRSALSRPSWKLTSIANLLGRSGSGHLLLGLLAVAPAGGLALNDLTGSISLDLSQATSIDESETWLCPGMIVLVDGVYEEEFAAGFGTSHGVGGTIKGRFVGFSVGAPGCEPRAATLGISASLADRGAPELDALSTGFGWVDFLGLGSERAVGPRMRRLEQRLLHHTSPSSASSSTTVVLLGEVHLDDPHCVAALSSVLAHYAAAPTPPFAFVLLGNFTRHAAMSTPRAHGSSPLGSSSAGGAPDSMTYKEHFDALAALLGAHPSLLRASTWVFVPGDNDAWDSAFCAGAAVPLPRGPVPDVFTGRVRRAFAAAAHAGGGGAAAAGGAGLNAGGPVFTTNPARLSLFGPAHELLCFRDDAMGRLRRAAIPLQKAASAQDRQRHSLAGAVDADGDDDLMQLDVNNAGAGAALAPDQQAARRLVKTLLDQSHLSPYALSTRPVHWAYGGALALHPLPTALVLCDAEAAPFVVTYQGCVVLNPGRLVGGACGGLSSAAGTGAGTGTGAGRERGRARWAEWDVRERRGRLRSL